jgi:3-oxoadipate enol-lactonase
VNSPIAPLAPPLHRERQEGEGLPLILAHPIGASLRFWDALMPHLAGHGPVVRYDLRGHGQSPVSAEEGSIEQFADDLLAVADAEGFERFDLCGVSLGGMVALAVAARHGQRVHRVVVSSTAANVAPPPPGWNGRREAALKDGMAPLAGPMVERMFSAAFRETADPLIDTLKTVFERMRPTGYANAVSILRDADLGERLARVQSPTLVIAGQQDPLCPPQKQQALVDALPRAELAVLDCGHFPPVEQAAEFARLLRGWIRPSQA